MTAAFEFSLASTDDQDTATAYLEDILLEAEHMMPCHRVEWLSEFIVRVSLGHSSAPGDLDEILKALQWAARMACTETFYEVTLLQVAGDHITVNWVNRAEILKQRL